MDIEEKRNLNILDAMKLGLYTFVDEEVVLDEEHEHLRPVIEQLNATGRVDISDVDYRDRNYLMDYWPYHFYFEYKGIDKWDGYLVDFKNKKNGQKFRTKKQREADAKAAEEKARLDAIKKKEEAALQKKKETMGKFVEFFYKLYVIIDTFFG